LYHKHNRQNKNNQRDNHRKQSQKKTISVKVLFSEYGDKDFLKRIIELAHHKIVAEWINLRKELNNEMDLCEDNKDKFTHYF